LLTSSNFIVFRLAATIPMRETYLDQQAFFRQLRAGTAV
jgi:hypothetical protein